jgi:hypothetical protein
MMIERYEEPMYDDCTLELIEQLETEELISALADYCKDLEEQIVELRCQVNKLTPVVNSEPFPDPHSDLYEVFYHYAAYPKFKHILKQLD